ncbi:membrane-associated proteins in eicosanoid and glutathione metabolism [Mrakia frigida]|uniref:MAPEG family protein n=1 Tax=Mrakia frigida TaxID=29902 RepID=UPI003FCC04A6
MAVTAVPVSILSLLPANYGWVALAGASTFLLHVYQVLQVSKYRKASKVAYPQFYAEKSEMEASVDAKLLNCAQRAHGNTLEVLPHMLFASLFSGLAYPITAAALLATWVVGRVLFTYGYVTGNPAARYHYGGMFHIIGFLGTFGLVTYTAGQMAYASLL